MKNYKISLQSIVVKGDADDQETMADDIFEKVIAMAEAGTLGWEIDWDSEEDDEDN